MYIKTPKRYARRGRRHNVFSLRSVLLWITVPLLLFILIGVYENRDMFIPGISEALEGVAQDAGETVREINSAPPTPTPDPSNDLQRALESWRRGSIEEAVNIYERVIASVPNDHTVHYRLALGLLMEGRLQDAVQAAENAITANPFSADTWTIHSMALNRLGQDEQAIASAKRALEIANESAVAEDPTLAMSRARAQALLAEAYLNAGQGERARTLVEQALETYPDSFEAHQVAGRVNLEVVFDQDAAMNDFRTAYDIAPNMIYLGIWVARMEQILQNGQAALDLYQDMLEQNPTNTQLLYAIGDYYRLVEGNPSEAASYLQRCVEADPTYADCHYLLGRTLSATEQYIAAQEAYQRAIDLNPTGQNGRYYWWYANANQNLGQCPQALTYLQTGYQIAQEAEDTDLIEAFETSLGECGRPVGPVLEIPPEVTPEVTGQDT
ncbi:MAG: hypothetical protein OHK0046_35610 [Anaerolineae bacterium]